MTAQRPKTRGDLRVALVDSKEATNHPMWFEDSDMARHIPGTFISEGMTATIKALPFGDVHVMLQDFTRLIIELKTWEDLHAAVRDTGEGRGDSRIRHQLRGLLDLQAKGHKVWIMVVGVVTLAGGKGAGAKGIYTQHKGTTRTKRNWSFFELEQIRAEIQSLGIRVYQAPSETQVPHAIKLLADAAEEGYAFQQPGLPKVKSLYPRVSFLATSLTAVDGIGVTTALTIANEYRTFARFWAEGTVDSLAKLPGIGKPTAQKIYAAFHSLSADAEKPMSELTPEDLRA